MASEITTKPQTKASFTITLNSLANGNAEQSTMINNSSNYPAAIVYVKITSNATPTANNTYDVFLLRGDDPISSTYRTDGAGASDAAITIKNAIPLGSITNTGSASEVSYGEFDTSALGPLGPEWGIAIRNSSGAAIAGSGNLAEYIYYNPEIN